LCDGQREKSLTVAFILSLVSSYILQKEQFQILPNVSI
jgi:hypothetical protein